MIAVQNLSVTFGRQELFKEISYVINPKDRIGLVGKNGVGKSTLLKVIYGEQVPTKGNVVVPQDRTIGYLPQEVSNSSTLSIYDEALTAFDEINKLEAAIEKINDELGERTDYESDAYGELIDKLTDYHTQIDHLGGHKKEGEVGKILKGLGFVEKDFERPMSEFSGGWQMRVELAKLILKEPDLLLLDEPTNHLDIESILWLEQVLINYPGAIVMISHDRMFLDNITNRTVEIVFGKIYDYKTNYSHFFQLREERLEQQRNAYKNQQSFIEQQERFIERFRAKATKAAAAQSAQKRLDKLERIEFDELDASTIRFKFPPAPRSGDVVLRGEKVSKNYGEKEVLKNVDIYVERGERVAFVGKNGQGKSTLVKMILDEVDYDGEVKIGHNVDVGYYAQIQENTLDDKKTVLKTIEDEATGEWANIARIRGLLGSFLFDADEMEKKVSVLSGGEKSRLALAKLLLTPVNLLILDEPTNHLDMASKEMLKEALLQYDGTLILVSHDRDFLQGLTDKTFEFSDKRIREHYGEISGFLDAHKVDTFRQFETDRIKNEGSGKGKKAGQKSDYQNKKDKDKKHRQLTNAIKKSERQIEELEEGIAECVTKLQDPEFYHQKEEFQANVKQHEKLKAELDKAMQLWEEQTEALDKFES